MPSTAVLCPRCGSPNLSVLGSGTLCLSCLGRRLLESIEAEPDDPAHLDAALAATSADKTVAAIPERLGTYEILDEIGRGGMGIVFSARHLELGRVVALKVIRRGEWSTATEESRFLREAQAAGKLRHAGIVTIFDVGRQDAWLFYAMDYLEGGDLAQLATRGPVPLRRAAELVAAIAGAVEHAHQHGIIHRDLKPSNILLDVAGNPFVADFGLARWTHETADLTRTGVVIGSPAYMAPEQATGDATPASDVYGLGGILYFVLTGRAPQQGTAAEILARSGQGDVPLPTTLRAEIPPALDAICRRALARDPAQRYPTAAALADDLARWLDNREVEAPLAAPAEARRRFAQLLAQFREGGIEHWNHAARTAEAEAITRLDPEFAEAWALQARIHCQVVDFSIDISAARQDLARAALARALAIDPHHPAVRAAAGGVAASLDNDFATALRLYREIAEEFPNDAEALFRYGRLARRAGQWREGNRMMGRAARLEPDNASARAIAAFGFYAVRDFPQAVLLIDEAVRIRSNSFQHRSFQIWFHWQRDPLPARALQEIRALPPEMRQLRDVAWIECQFLIATSRFAEALAVYRTAPMTSCEHALQVLHEQTFELRLARLARDPSAAELEAALRESLSPGRLPVELTTDQHSLLAHTYAVLGDAAASDRHSRPILDAASITALDGARKHGHNEFFANPGHIMNLALLGETEAALQTLARMLNVPGAVDVRTIAFEPAFAALRADPRYPALIAQAQFPVAAQDGPETVAGAALTLPPRAVPA